VKILPHTINLRSSWLRKPFATLAVQHWLVDDASLTARLQNRYADFKVQPIMHKPSKLIQDEVALLKLQRAKTAIVRDVLLMGNQQPVVYAHSILPKVSMRGGWHQLGQLGNKPLGATLFKNPRVQRTPLSYKKLSKNHDLYRQAIQHLSDPPTYLWARRSVFSLNCAKILVTEVFLPTLQHE
jgi:chorismate--pyruvate lyase